MNTLLRPAANVRAPAIGTDARIEAVNEALAGDSWSALIRHERPRHERSAFVSRDVVMSTSA